MLLHLGALLAALGARGNDEGGVAARAELAIDRGDHDVDVRDPAVGRPGLLPVDDPLVLGLVVLGGGAVAGDVGAGVRLRRAERGDLDVVLGAEALRHPLDHLLGRARAEDPGDRERRPEDRHPDPGVAPEELLVHEGEGEPGRIGPELRDRLEAVEPDLGRLLHDGPGELLLLVPLVRGGADDLLGEPMRPVAHVLLILGELEREGGLAGLDPKLLLDLSLVDLPVLPLLLSLLRRLLLSGRHDASSPPQVWSHAALGCYQSSKILPEVGMGKLDGGESTEPGRRVTPRGPKARQGGSLRRGTLRSARGVRPGPRRSPPAWRGRHRSPAQSGRCSPG